MTIKILPLCVVLVTIVAGYRIDRYVDQIERSDNCGNTLLEPMRFCSIFKLRNPDLNPKVYVLDKSSDTKSADRSAFIKFLGTNEWRASSRDAFLCDRWNRAELREVLRVGSDVGWMNCRFKGRVMRALSIGLDLSLVGIGKMLWTMIRYAMSLKAVEIVPQFPEIRRSVCMSTGQGSASLKIWAPSKSHKFYRFDIDQGRSVLRISSANFRATSRLLIICGCLSGISHKVNGSIIELKLADYHSCLLSSASLAWRESNIIYGTRGPKPGSKPFVALRSIELYDPGTPAMLLGVGSLGDETMGMQDCRQNQVESLWTDYT